MELALLFSKPRNSLATRSAFLEPFRFISWFNFTCFVEIMFLKRWLQARIELASFESFLWLFNLMLNVEYAFPTYWILHNMHSIRQITYSLLQLIFIESHKLKNAEITELIEHYLLKLKLVMSITVIIIIIIIIVIIIIIIILSKLS